MCLVRKQFNHKKNNDCFYRYSIFILNFIFLRKNGRKDQNAQGKEYSE